MRAVWDGAPATARDVQARLAAATGWAYSTVRTLLQRLVEKGALAVAMRANTGYFTPLLQPRAARRSALRTLVRAAFDGSFGALLQHLAADEELSASDLAKLQALQSEVADGAAEVAAPLPPRDERRKARRPRRTR